MNSRNHTIDDYQMFCEWWKSWGWTPVPYEFLPPNSIVVERDGKPLAAVFLYITDTPIVWVENYISDRDMTDRGGVIEFLISEAEAKVKQLGKYVAMSAVRHRSLAAKLTAAGFTEADKSLTNYIKAVH